MRRVVPQTLGGQLLAMLLLALAITQGLGVWLLTDERNRAVRAALGSEAAGRAANIALLLEAAPDDLHAPILRAAESPLVRFAVAPAPEVARNDPAARLCCVRSSGSWAIRRAMCGWMSRPGPTR